ncbi:MAG TPA: GyrI-like domain-containing protein, partial [Chitinophagaceae bacterium]|nr:GyrI-like domain-containing protein [Chitinophagaceae bacterium]
IKNSQINSELTFISKGTDSTIIHIETSIPVGYNPFERINLYFKSKKLEKSLSEILQSINDVYSNVEKLYDYNIQKKLVVDSILVFTSTEIKGNPSTGSVYALIDELKSYIKQHAATETGLPMQNIFTSDSMNYVIKVAIPVNKRLPDSGKFKYRWMLGGGNILITEVKGDQNEINKAYKQILNYISDYRRVAPAIPFESLVTDRRKEPDSSKWITHIYYPVM